MTRRLALMLRDSSGVAAAELALLLPLLTVLLFGGMEMGNFMWAEHQVIKTVRAGTRFAARQPAENFVCGATDVGAMDDAVRNMLRTGTPADGGDPIVRGWDDGVGDIDISIECDAASDYANGGIYADTSAGGTPEFASAMRVVVSVTVPFPALFGFGFLDGQSITADAQSPVTGF